MGSIDRPNPLLWMYAVCLTVPMVDRHLLDLPLVDVAATLVIVLVIPGHALMGVLLPRLLLDEEGRYDVDGLLLIPAISLSLVLFLAFGLAILGHATHENIVLTCIGLSVLLLSLCWVRRQEAIRFEFEAVSSISIAWDLQASRSKALLAISIAGLILSAAVLSLDPADDDWVEFHLAAESGLVDDIPAALAANETLVLIVGVDAHGGDRTFGIEQTVHLASDSNVSSSTTLSEVGRVEVDTFSVSEDAPTSHRFETSFASSGHHLVTFHLNEAGSSEPVSSLQVWIEVV